MKTRFQGLSHFVGMLVAGLVLGFALARELPELADVNPWWWVSLAVLLILHSLYFLAVNKMREK